jgi:dynein heavy chain
MDRGHIVLAGLPSVGRKTVTRLAAFVERMIIQRLEITKNFGLAQFRVKMKAVWEEAAYGKKDNLSTVFIIEESDIIQESFLEDIQNILSTGLVPNLYTPDDAARVRDELKSAYKMDG